MLHLCVLISWPLLTWMSCIVFCIDLVINRCVFVWWGLHVKKAMLMAYSIWGSLSRPARVKPFARVRHFKMCVCLCVCVGKPNLLTLRIYQSVYS